MSISEIVEAHAVELRAQLLRYICNVSTRVRESSNTNFRLRDDFEYFWMTHFHSRPYTQAGQLNNLAKVFALIRMIDESSVKQIDLHSNNEQLIRIVEQISDVRKIEIRVFNLSEASPSRPWRSRVKSRIPRPV
ncbi:MAG: hypothetical protein ACKPAJ_02960, partial [Actinomycetota bacterium]